MKLASIILVLGGPLLAHAQPKPPAKQAGVCAPAHLDALDVHVAGAHAVACWKEHDQPAQCISATPTSQPQRAVPPAPALSRSAPVRQENGAWVACVGTTCKKLGKKAAAGAKKAEAAARANGYPEAMLVTADLAAVVVGRQAFALRTDKPIKLKAPKRQPGGEKPFMGGVDVAHNFLMPSWADCAGPCTQAVLADTRGNNKSPWFPSGKPIVLGGDRIAIVPQEAEGTMTVLDANTGKQLGKLVIGDGVLAAMNGAKVDDTTIVVAWNDVDAVKLQWISLPAGGAPTKGATKTIAHCP